MNQSEWQQKLDAEFPNGVDVTQVQDVPEGSDNYQLLCPRMIVAEINDNDLPNLYSYPLNIGSSKDTTIHIASIEKDEPGYLDVTDGQGNQWILQPITAPGAIKRVQTERKLNPSFFEPA